jgi:PAS domain S-box-containing protein
MIHEDNQSQSFKDRYSKKDREIEKLKTKVKIYEEKYRLSEEKSNLFFENSPDMIYEIDFQGPKFISVNNTICKKLGYSREELLEMNPMDILDDESKNIFQERINQYLSGIKPIDRIEYTGYSKDGEKVIGDLNIIFTLKNNKPMGAIVIAHDLTDSKKVENALIDIELRYNALFSNKVNGMAYCKAIFDDEGNPIDALFLDVNEMFEDLTGLKRADIIGSSARELIPGIENSKDVDLLNILNKVALLEEDVKFEIYQEFLELWYDAFVYSPKKTYFMAIFSDITDRKNTEKHKKELLEREKTLSQELQVSNAELIHIRDELEETIKKLEISNKDLEQFAYIASHDLQEPLRMISNFIQLLEKTYKDKLDENGLEYIGFVVDGAQRMHRIINDLLLFSRVTTDAGKFEQLDLNKVLDAVLFNLEIAIEENNAVISSDPLPVIFGDYSQMVQVFQNIIGNAIKYRSKKTPEIQISVLKQDDYWLFSVKDNGIGLKPQFSNQIFEIFRRLHSRHEYEGSGIGLAISKKVVERHGGLIWVESEPEKGSIFHFTIPK